MRVEAEQQLGQKRSLKGILNRTGYWFDPGSVKPNELTHEGSLWRLPKDPSLLVEIKDEFVFHGLVTLNSLVAYEIAKGERSETNTPDNDFIDVLKDKLNSAYTNCKGVSVRISGSQVNELTRRGIRMMEEKQDGNLGYRVGVFTDELRHMYDRRLKKVR